jgi:hypothetical protein
MRYALSFVVLFVLLASPVYAANGDSHPLETAWSALQTSGRALQRFVTDTSLLAVDRDDETERAYAWHENRQTIRALSASYLALSVLDWRTTTQALQNGAQEVNPMMSGVAPHSGIFLATKVGLSMTTLYAAERIRRHNRPMAMIVMIGANVAMSAVVAHNAAMK